MTVPTTKYVLSLDRARVSDFTDYLALEGVTITFDRHDIAALASARDKVRELRAEGFIGELGVRGSDPEVEFLGLDGLHELEVEAITISETGSITIRAEVRHGRGEGVEVVIALAELEAVAVA